MKRVLSLVLWVGCQAHPDAPRLQPQPMPQPVADAWWAEAAPCPADATLRTDALRLSDGTRRTLAVYCMARDARVGRSSAWYPDGTLRSRGAHVDNRPDGEWELNWPSGKPWYRVTVRAGLPVGPGEMFSESGAPLALGVALPVTGIAECDDDLRELALAPASRAQAMELGTVVVTELENKHPDQLGRCSADPPTIRIVPDDPAFAATFDRFRHHGSPGASCRPQKGAAIIGGFDVTQGDPFQDTCTSCGFTYQRRPYPQPQRCSSPILPIADLPLTLASCPDNELDTDVMPSGERIAVVDGTQPMVYRCHASVEHDLERGMWRFVVPVAFDPRTPPEATMQATMKVVSGAIRQAGFGPPALITEAFTRFTDPARLLEADVAIEPWRSNDDPLPAAQRTALGVAGYLVVEVWRIEPPDDDRHPSGK